jgi:hypothetical protein
MLCYCSPCNGIARNRDLSCFRGIFLTVIAAWRVGPGTEFSLPSFMSAVAGPNGGVTAIAVVFFLIFRLPVYPRVIRPAFPDAISLSLGVPLLHRLAQL